MTNREWRQCCYCCQDELQHVFRHEMTYRETLDEAGVSERHVEALCRLYDYFAGEEGAADRPYPCPRNVVSDDAWTAAPPYGAGTDCDDESPF